MKITESEKYKGGLKEIAFYIKKDKLNASINFVKELKENINNLVNFPHKYKKSIYYADENIRDMTFNGYTIVYEIFEDKIEIMTIFNQNKPTKE
jgi:plasmid stabilization system protein ParE